MEHASPMDSLQCDDNMHHFGNNIIKGLATASSRYKLGSMFPVAFILLWSNRPGGGSLSATLGNLQWLSRTRE